MLLYIEEVTMRKIFAYLRISGKGR